jgi:hypothetical protein
VIQVFEAIGTYSLVIVAAFIAYSIIDYLNGGWK